MESREREVGDERRHRFIGFFRELRVVSLDVVMPIPTALVLHTSAVNLHVSHATLNHAAPGQALRSDMLATVVVQTVQALDMFRFLLHVERLGRGTLHAISQLETFNARLELLLIWARLKMLPVQLIEQIQLTPLL